MKPTTTTAQLAADYRRGLSLRQVAARHGLHYTGVPERLRAAGVALRRPGQYERTEAIRAQHADATRQQHADGRARPFGNQQRRYELLDPATPLTVKAAPDAPQGQLDMFFEEKAA